MDAKGFQDSTETKPADRLAGDAIINYKTIHAFGCDKEIIEEYEELLSIPA